MSKHHWEFDQESIDALAAKLGLKFPILVRGKRGRPGRVVGTHSMYDTYGGKYIGIHHIIKLSRHLSQEKAECFLRHELCHAVQQESFIEDGGSAWAGIVAFDRAYNAAGGNAYRGKNYKDNPYEVEAREAEEQHPEFKLTKLTKFGREFQERVAARKAAREELDRAFDVMSETA